MNCIFSHTCHKIVTESQASACSNLDKSVCEDCHYQSRYMIDRSGKLFGAEIYSTWYQHKYSQAQGYPSLTHIHDFKKMLRQLLAKLEQGQDLNLEGSRFFLTIERIHLLDSDIVNTLVKLFHFLDKQQMTLTLLLHNSNTALAEFTSEAKYLLKDLGVRLCLMNPSIDTLSSANLHLFECLLFNTTRLRQECTRLPEQVVVDKLFMLRERGFGLILADVQSADDYNFGLNLPFSYFYAEHLH
ncbi:MAG: hypothetical protein ACRCT7_14160, partial [Shewanella sp.]